MEKNKNDVKLASYKRLVTSTIKIPNKREDEQPCPTLLLLCVELRLKQCLLRVVDVSDVAVPVPRACTVTCNNTAEVVLRDRHLSVQVCGVAHPHATKTVVHVVHVKVHKEVRHTNLRNFGLMEASVRAALNDTLYTSSE